jgi:homoserine kinase
MARKAESCTVFAPATVANVGVGFDVLGFAIAAAGDTVRVRLRKEMGVVIDSVSGVVPDLPTEADRNTASVALQALAEDLRLTHGFGVEVDKGIPLGSGMGGSAASAVGAVVAGNGLLDRPLPRERLLTYALEGERAASGAPHADNAAPCLYGGLTALVADNPPRVVSIPVPAELSVVLVHPDRRIDTRDAREVLRKEIGLREHVEQSMRLCGLIVGCFNGDLKLIGESLQDRIIEPQRSRLIEGFDVAAAAANDAGALGFGIAGSGPSVFALCADDDSAESTRAAVVRAFREQSVDSEGWVSSIDAGGAAVVDS